jgi:hypothetical protein
MIDQKNRVVTRKLESKLMELNKNVILNVSTIFINTSEIELETLLKLKTCI